MAMRWAITSTASTAPLWVFAHRAIWFRLVPMRDTCRVRSRSTSAAGTVQVRVRAIARRTSAESGTPAAFGLGPPVGGLAPREANGDQDRAASSHRDAPSRGERGRRPRPCHRPERGSVGDRRGGDPRQPRGYTEGRPLPSLSGVRQARPPQPQRLRLNASHRPLRRAHVARGSRLGPPSRRPPPKSCPPPTLLDPVADVLGAERPLAPAQVDDGIAGVRVELAGSASP